MPAYIHHHRVLFHETDAARIVHFANFFRFAEEAETHAMASLGFRMDDHAYPRVHAVADYLAPLHFWDDCEIHAALEEIGSGSLHWRFDFRCNDHLCATVRYVSARRNARDNSPAPYTDEEKNRLKNLISIPNL